MGVPLYHHPEKKESLKMTSMMIRSTVAAGKGQLLKASTRAVPLGTVADHSAPPNVAIGTTSFAMSKALSSQLLMDPLHEICLMSNTNSTTIWKSLALTITAELVPKTQLRKQMM